MNAALNLDPPMLGPPPPEASVIIVLHDSGDALAACIGSIPPHFEVVIADNASVDSGPEIARELRPDAVAAPGPNLGFGAGCNRGARAASGSVLIFLNPDSRAEPGALEALAAATRPGSIFGPNLVDPDGKLRANARRRSRLGQDIAALLPASARWIPDSLRRDLPPTSAIYDTGGPVDYLQGACLAIEAASFAAIGGFDETFFLYSEEEDLCERLRAAGGTCELIASARVAHIGATSSRKIGELAAFHLFRSKLLLYRKRSRAGGAAAWALLSAAVTLAAATNRLRATRRRPPGWGAAARRGLRDGLATPLNQTRRA